MVFGINSTRTAVNYTHFRLIQFPFALLGYRFGTQIWSSFSNQCVLGSLPSLPPLSLSPYFPHPPLSSLPPFLTPSLPPSLSLSPPPSSLSPPSPSPLSLPSLPPSLLRVCQQVITIVQDNSAPCFVLVGLL